MLFRGLLGVSAVLLAGCSIVYNPDNLDQPTDAPELDAPLDAATDADTSMFDITSVDPVEIDEGVGSDNGRPALFILHGSSIVLADAVVSVGFVEDTSGDAGMPDGGMPMPIQVEFNVADNATQAGVSVKIPVLPDLHEDQDALMRITVVQNGITKTQDVTVHGHDELTLTAANQLPFPAPLYSQITVANNLRFGGVEVIRLRATAGITFNGIVDGDAVGVTAGPHGCSGGGSSTPGNCGDGGGRPGTNAAILGLNNGSGGGGGSFAAVATGGGGTMAGTAGAPSGNDMLLPVESGPGAAGNRGNGGGGGGAGLLNAAGGVGGGGGGVLYVQAGGDITVTAMGGLRAAGGAGTVAQGSGGGGGSGGALLVRTGGTIVSTTRWLSAPAGPGGDGVNDGGAGSAGRIRVDAAGGDIGAMANNPSAVQGPAWGSSVPLTTSTSPFTALFRGKPDRAYEIRLNDAPDGTATPGSQGTVNVTGLDLIPGRNELCAVAQTGDLGVDSMTCIEIFYIGN